MLITIPAGVILSNGDLRAANLPGFVLNDGARQQIQVPDGLDNSVLTAIMSYVCAPSVALRRKASDDWALCMAKLAALPAAPEEGEDLYVHIRERLESERDGYLAVAEELGGLL